MEKHFLFAFSLSISFILVCSCSKKNYETSVEKSIDSLIYCSLQMHKAKEISVFLVDSTDRVVANRKGHWSSDGGDIKIEPGKPKDVIAPGQLLLPVLALAAIHHQGVSPDTFLSVLPQQIAGVWLEDCQKVNVHTLQVTADSLPLRKAMLSPPAIVALSMACFPEIEQVRSALSLYLPGINIPRRTDYIDICRGRGGVTVKPYTLLSCFRKHSSTLTSDTSDSISFSCVTVDGKERSKEFCLVHTSRTSILVVFDGLCLPGAQKLAQEILRTIQ